MTRPINNTLLTLVSVLCAAVAAASAEEYFVSPTGNDGATGFTPSQSLRSIQAAVNKCTDAGNTIYVAPGTYAETVEIGLGGGIDAGSGTAEDPNQIIGDFSGSWTGATPGPVILSGGGARQFGVRIQDRSWWELLSLTIRDQTQYGINGQQCTGIRVDNCTIEVPQYYAVYLMGGANYTVERCDFERVPASGHCIWTYPYQVTQAGAYVRIRRNNFAMKGDLYLSTPYRDGQFLTIDGNRHYSYGIVVLDWNRWWGGVGLAEIAIENNVFSDLYYPLIGYQYNTEAAAIDMRISGNTIVGCFYSLAAYSLGGSTAVASNNVVSQCYHGPLAYNAHLYGLLTHEIATEPNPNWINNSVIEGEITGEDPMLADPANGDWSPLPGSPLIDSGYATGSPLVDYLGNDRPYDGDRNGESNHDLGAVEYGASGSLFVDVSEDTGFDISNSSYEHRGSGLHWGDLDDDGDLDAIVTGVGSAVLLNGGATFTATSLGGGQAWRQGALLDADNDGDLDFYASCYNSYYNESVYINNGAGAMTTGDDAGFVAASNNEGLAAADINGDGLTDLVIFSDNGNWKGINVSADGVIDFDAEIDDGDGMTNSIYAGNGDYASSADVNNDGYPDFFYHYSNGSLFVSDGEGGYTADTSAISVATGNGIKFGSAWGDFDNDGDMDLFTPARSNGTRGALFEDNGASYINIAGSVGIEDTSEQYSASWGDYDNDGDLDLLIATGSDAPFLLYRNEGNGGFVEADDGPTIDGLVHDAVFVDYDNDGDLDIAATRPGGTNVLMQNILDDGAALRVRAVWLTTEGAGVDAVGARIELLDASGSTLLARREAGTARGFGGSTPLWVHFGGVEALTTYTVRVTWPGGEVTSAQVVPSEVSSTFGERSVSRLLTMTHELRSAVRVVQWREVSPADD